MEGLFYLIARLLAKACPGMPFLFALTPALSQGEREYEESKNRVGRNEECS